MNWGALKAIIKHYVLDDRQLRRTFLGGMGSMGMVMFVLVLAPILIYKKLPALFLFVVSSGSSVGAGLGMSLAMASVIQREKAEGSFRVLCALPLRAETLFFGTVLASFISSILAFVPLYAIATIGLILLDRDVALLQIYVGWAALLMFFLSASVGSTMALCVNSPTAILNLVLGFSSLFTLLVSLRVFFDIPRFSEEDALRFIRFILSLEGVVFVSAIMIMVSVLIFYLGSRLFLRKRSYV
jgi:hypothetical protein